MHILVTGGAGFIGSSLSHVLLKNFGCKVTVIDNLSPYYNPIYKKENLRSLSMYKHFSFLEGDITDTVFLEKVFTRNTFDKVVHLASSVGVRHSFENPQEYKKNNVMGTKLMLHIAARHKVHQFIFASSSSVYGNNTPAPFVEDMVQPDTLTPYALSKKNAEEECLQAHIAFGLPVTVLRFFTVYGPRGRPDMSPYIFTDAMLHEKPIHVFGTGDARRDFTNIQDIVDGITLALSKEYPYEVFNLGDASPVDMMFFIHTIESLTKKRAIILHKKHIVGEMKETFADIKKAGTMLGYRPKVGLAEGLETFIYWFKKNRI